MSFRLGSAVSACLLLWALPASATYSIVGADRTTREVGGAGTSCLNGADVYIIYGAAPGLGAVHAQARANQGGRDRAVELLEQGMAPAEILEAITAPAFDDDAASRQYGIVDATGRAAGFTGDDTLAYAEDRQGQIGAFSYSVQGNILTSQAVLTQAATAFEASGCDLAERLMLALEAGAANGEGDSRCTPEGIPSDSAFLQVERAGEELGSYAALRVRASGSDDPIALLRQQFDDWRDTHPCPAPEGDAGVAGSSSGGASGGSAGTGGAATAGSGASAGLPTGGNAGSGGSPAASGGGAPAAGSGGAEARLAADDDGCGCRLHRAGRGAGGIAALLLLLLLRRRRR